MGKDTIALALGEGLRDLPLTADGQEQVDSFYASFKQVGRFRRTLGDRCRGVSEA